LPRESLHRDRLYRSLPPGSIATPHLRYSVYLPRRSSRQPATAHNPAGMQYATDRYPIFHMRGSVSSKRPRRLPLGQCRQHLRSCPRNSSPSPRRGPYGSRLGHTIYPLSSLWSVLTTDRDPVHRRVVPSGLSHTSGKLPHHFPMRSHHTARARTGQRSLPLRESVPNSRPPTDRKSTRLNSSHVKISYAVFCLTKQTMRS